MTSPDASLSLAAHAVRVAGLAADAANDAVNALHYAVAVRSAAQSFAGVSDDEAVADAVAAADEAGEVAARALYHAASALSFAVVSAAEWDAPGPAPDLERSGRLAGDAADEAASARRNAACSRDRAQAALTRLRAGVRGIAAGARRGDVL